MSGEYVPKVTPEMISVGVAVFDDLSGSYSTYGLVEQVYIAMRQLESVSPSHEGAEEIGRPTQRTPRTGG